jgi:copper chaperone CopZ
MGNVIVILLIAGLAAFALAAAVRRNRNGQGCCGGQERMPDKVRPADPNRAHYPYHTHAKVDGMTCDRCARRVENALNCLDGVYAAVDIGTCTASIRTKQPLDEAELRTAVQEAGYVLHDFQPA